MKIGGVLFLFLIFPGLTYGASHYIRAGATGANDGSSWANAWTTFPSGSNFVRGDEYYVADGNYGGSFYLSKATSGTTPIKICKATVSTQGACSSPHGSDVGWDNSYGDGQAIFNGGGIEFASGYWIFDGVKGLGSRGASGSQPTTYGFYFIPPKAGSTIRPVQFSGSDIRILHTAVTCPGAAGDIQQFGFSGVGARVSISNSFVENCQTSMWNQGADNLIENSYLGKHWSSAANHGTQVQQVTRPIFRNNIVTFCEPQCIEPGGGATTNMTDGQIYNNVFMNITTGNGVLKATSSSSILNTVMYGNTVINSEGPILYQNNEGLGHGSGNTVVNNLFYNCKAIINQSTGSPVTHSHNALFDSGSISESNVQIGSGNPFVDLAGGNYRLKAATSPGMALASPYNLDLMGVARSAWTRGAYEFSIGGPSLLSAPSNLRVVP
jgi:hypothetical protein